jgi:hypothetical protein
MKKKLASRAGGRTPTPGVSSRLTRWGRPPRAHLLVELIGELVRDQGWVDGGGVGSPYRSFTRLTAALERNRTNSLSNWSSATWLRWRRASAVSMRSCWAPKTSINVRSLSEGESRDRFACAPDVDKTDCTRES